MSIKEFATRYGRSGPPTFFERDHEALVGAAKPSRRAIPVFRPFDMIGEPHKPVVIWQNVDAKFGVESMAGPEPYFRRNLDFDEITFQWAGHTRLECEYGTFEIGPGESTLIPAGISHRHIGTPDSLRVFVHTNEPVEVTLGEDKMVTHTEFEVTRIGGPSLGNGAVTTPKDTVTERMYLWEEPEEIDELERPYEDLVGGATLGRGMQKIRVFDFFESRTGVDKGPGPTFYVSPTFHAETYNTAGDMLAFHRGLDSDETWWQFCGESTNESEFGKFMLLPGEANHAPPGIAHRVVGTPEFLRLVLYTKRPLRLMIDPAKHLYESHFEPKVRVLKAAEWMSPAWVTA